VNDKNGQNVLFYKLISVYMPKFPIYNSHESCKVWLSYQKETVTAMLPEGGAP